MRITLERFIRGTEATIGSLSINGAIHVHFLPHLGQVVRAIRPAHCDDLSRGSPENRNRALPEKGLPQVRQDPGTRNLSLSRRYRDLP